MKNYSDWTRARPSGVEAIGAARGIGTKGVPPRRVARIFAIVLPLAREIARLEIIEAFLSFKSRCKITTIVASNFETRYHGCNFCAS